MSKMIQNIFSDNKQEHLCTKIKIINKGKKNRKIIENKFN